MGGEIVRRWLPPVLKAIAIATFVALMVGFTTASSGERTGRIVTTKLAGQNARLSYPSGTGTPKGVALWFHGQGGNAANRVQGPWLEALRRGGWVIASSDFHRTSWGNADSTDDARRLVEWAEDETGLDVKIWVSGSMGGAVALNALNFGVQPPPCWYGVKPAISLTQMDNVPGGRKFIAAAFNGKVPVDRDPVRNLDSLPISTRYRVVASQDDHWVLYDENSGPLITTLSGLGADVSLLRATGLHEDPSHFNAPDLVDFAETCRSDESTTQSAVSN